MNKKWWKNSTAYQIYPRSFHDSNGDGIGDIKGITEKLDYLQFLGIEVIWLSPVYQSPNDDNGYDISDYQNIMTEFGTMDDFDEMLREAHKRNIRIMMDLVINHSSDEHAWFVESRSSKDNPKRDYYIWRKGKNNGELPNNWGACFGGSVWEYDETTDEYFLHLFSKKQPDLNWENPGLRNEVYDMMNYWLTKGVDGFRMDVVNFISKKEGLPDGYRYEGADYGDGSPHYMNGPRIHEYLQEMNRETFSKYDTITVGEMPGVTVEEGKLYTGKNRNELDMVFHFEHVGLGDGRYGKWTPNDWKLTQLKEIFERWQIGLETDGWNSLYWSNHDQPRALSRWVPRFYDFPCKNDEYTRLKAAKMLATCLHFMKGTPYIYQGEEIGMTNVEFGSIDDYRDIETLNAYRDLVESGKLSKEEFFKGLHERSRDNARTPMQWDDSLNAGFTTGTPWIGVNPNYTSIHAKKEMENPDSIFHYYRKLIQLRKVNEVIVNGNFRLIDKENESVFSYIREYNGKKLLVMCNFNHWNEMIPNEILRGEEVKEWAKATLLIGNYPENEQVPKYELNPFEARVYQL